MRSSDVPMRRVAFVMEQTLGNVTHYLNLRQRESIVSGFTPEWLPIPFSDGRVPWAIRGSWLARTALSQCLGDVSGAFIHTTTIGLLSPDLFRRRPTIISTDGTAANKREMRDWYNARPESRGKAAAKSLVYRAAFAPARGFVAFSQWAKASFVEDYGCRPEDVAVIPPGVDTTLYTPGIKRMDRLPRVLFVGGDLRRKGGDLLIEVFRNRLRGKGTLVIATSPAEAPPAEPGIEVHVGLRANSPEILALYASADVFALPTHGDCHSLVGLEAMASGLPVVLTDVGGLPDIVDSGDTGYLVPKANVAELGDAIEALLADESLRLRMGARARSVAETRFDSAVTSRALYAFVEERTR